MNWKEILVANRVVLMILSLVGLALTVVGFARTPRPHVVALAWLVVFTLSAGAQWFSRRGNALLGHLAALANALAALAVVVSVARVSAQEGVDLLLWLAGAASAGFFLAPLVGWYRGLREPSRRQASIP